MTGRITLITRPQHQAASLYALLAERGVAAESFPVIEITSKNLDTKEEACLAALNEYDLVFFISANAVHQSMPYLSPLELNKQVQVAVIGPATKAALADYGVQADIMSTTVFNSEGLLERPELQHVVGKKALIFRGAGGRTLLADTLRARGVHVDSVATYQRALPTMDINPVQELLTAQNIEAIVVMSNESLNNLCTLVGGAEQLLSTALVVISERTAKHAKELGLSAIIAKSPSDNDVCTAVLQLYGINKEIPDE